MGTYTQSTFQLSGENKKIFPIVLPTVILENERTPEQFCQLTIIKKSTAASSEISEVTEDTFKGIRKMDCRI